MYLLDGVCRLRARLLLTVWLSLSQRVTVEEAIFSNNNSSNDNDKQQK